MEEYNLDTRILSSQISFEKRLSSSVRDLCFGLINSTVFDIMCKFKKNEDSVFLSKCQELKSEDSPYISREVIDESIKLLQKAYKEAVTPQEKIQCLELLCYYIQPHSKEDEFGKALIEVIVAYAPTNFPSFVQHVTSFNYFNDYTPMNILSWLCEIVEIMPHLGRSDGAHCIIEGNNKLPIQFKAVYHRISIHPALSNSLEEKEFSK